MTSLASITTSKAVPISSCPDVLGCRQSRPPTRSWTSIRGSVESGTQILIYTPDGGRQVVVQAPKSLVWDDATLARFASAVTVSADAQAGRG